MHVACLCTISLFFYGQYFTVNCCHGQNELVYINSIFQLTYCCSDFLFQTLIFQPFLWNWRLTQHSIQYCPKNLLENSLSCNPSNTVKPFSYHRWFLKSESQSPFGLLPSKWIWFSLNVCPTLYSFACEERDQYCILEELCKTVCESVLLHLHSLIQQMVTTQQYTLKWLKIITNTFK